MFRMTTLRFVTDLGLVCFTHGGGLVVANPSCVGQGSFVGVGESRGSYALGSSFAKRNPSCCSPGLIMVSKA